jgi:hypothetical protein
MLANGTVPQARICSEEKFWGGKVPSYFGEPTQLLIRKSPDTKGSRWKNRKEILRFAQDDGQNRCAADYVGETCVFKA